MTTAASLASYASSFPSFRNRIINGNFDIWQRGTSQTSSGYGSADRWRMDNIGSTLSVSQQAFTIGQTDVPSNPKYYLQHVVSSVPGAGNLVVLGQRIEGVQTLAEQTATLSFWAKADSNKNIATEFTRNFGTGGSPSAPVNSIGVTTHNLTTSWQKFTATVSIPSISGKTIGSNGNDYLQLLFWFDAGSSFTTRTNSLVNQSGTFDIAQVQLEEGTVATPFEHRPYGTELALCQRYYYRLTGAPQSPYGVCTGQSSTRAITVVTFPVSMRTAPTALEQSGTATHYYIRTAGGDTVCNSVPTIHDKCTVISGMVNTYVASGLSAGYAAIAGSNNTSGYLGWSAEI